MPVRKLMDGTRIFCHANTTNLECARTADHLRQRLLAAGFQLLESPASSAEGPPDLLLLLGGDGFLMESLHRFGYPPTPVFGVNFGAVGFHMNPQSCLETLPRLLREGRFISERYPVLELEAQLDGGEKRTARAFNDVVLERQTRQAIRFRMSVDGVLYNRFAGDGFVIATPAGSTAYNLAAGGPAVHPRVEAMVVTPLYPHRAAPFHSVQFSLMVPLTSRISVVADDLPKRAMRVVADGLPLEKVASVEISSSGGYVTLLRTTERDFIQTLSQKFT